MSKTNSGSNGRRRLEVVREKSAAQLEKEAERIRMDAQYIKWMRNTANDRQILELRDELRMHRTNAPEAMKLQQEAELLLQMVNYAVVRNSALEVEDAGEIEAARSNSTQAQEMMEDDQVNYLIEITPEDMAEHLRGRTCQIAVTDDNKSWIIQVSHRVDEDGERVD